MGGHPHALVAVVLGKTPPVPIGYEAESAPEPSWTLWEEKILASSLNRIPVMCMLQLKPEIRY